MIDAVKLHRLAARRRAGLFLAEGPNLVEAAQHAGAIDQVFATLDASSRFEHLLAGTQVRLVTERAAKALSDTVTPVGLVALCRSVALPLEELMATAPRFIVVAVDVSEPGNAGTLIRVSDAMGADGVIFAGHSVDPLNGKCLRASAGSIFHIPVAIAEDSAHLAQTLLAGGISLLATTLDGDRQLDDVDEIIASRVAWLFGNEAHGLPESVARLASQRIRIPMRGGAESLNLASAASICLYATARAYRRSC